MLLTLEVKYRDELSAVGARAAVPRLEKSVRQEHLDTRRIDLASESVAQDEAAD